MRSVSLSLQEQLRALFSLDQQVRGLRSRVDAGTRRFNAQRTKLEQFQRQAEELNDQFKKTQAAAMTLEGDANGVESKIESLRQTMSTVRNNKEYSALLVEVNTLKLEKGKYEELALEQMAKVDELKARVDEVQGKAAEQGKLVELAQKEVDEAQAEISDQLDALTKERDAAAEHIDPDTLSLYRKLADDYDGEALAQVEEQDRRRMEYTCGACFMSLPIQVVNAALTTTDRPVVCVSCDRILYVSGELKEGLVPK